MMANIDLLTYSLCEWFIDNKLSIHFGDDKRKTVHFLLIKSPAKTERRLLFKTAQYCEMSRLLS